MRGTIHGAPMGGWEFAKAMVDMSQWLQSTGCRLNNRPIGANRERVLRNLGVLKRLGWAGAGTLGFGVAKELWDLIP